MHDRAALQILKTLNKQFYITHSSYNEKSILKFLLALATKCVDQVLIKEYKFTREDIVLQCLLVLANPLAFYGN